SKFLQTTQGLNPSIIEAIGGAAMTANAVGAAFNIFSGVFGGGSPLSPSSGPDSDILGEIAALQNQVAQLQATMINRFDRVDQEINQVLSTLNTNFAQINAQLGIVIGDLNGIENVLVSIQNQLNVIEQYILATAQANDRSDFFIGGTTGTANCLNYRSS